MALNVPLHRYFDYLLPPAFNACQGGRVVVPFGRQTKIGIVVDFPQTSDVPTEKLKPIKAALDSSPIFDSEMWQLLNWAARYYHAPIGEVLTGALPIKLRNGDSTERVQSNYFVVTEQGRKSLIIGENKKAKKQVELLTELAECAKYFEKPTACSPSAWKGLLEKGYIEKIDVPFMAQAWQDSLGEFPLVNTNNRLILNKQQTLVVSRLNAQTTFASFLLNGVTGSGKTEVYLQLIETVLKREEQVLLLVPEIGLTPQTVQRFKARFNVEIDVLHSNMNETERLNAWLRAKNGESAIVIGTRSALFTQFQKLGVIILDEEHDSSFKQQDGWRYHARDLAVVRAKNANIPIVLGSATPSLESLHNVQNGKFIELTLTARAGNAQLANQQIIDLKTQRVTAGLSERLLSMMKTQLEQGNQVMLFLNRRGFAPVLLCHECGWVCECEACNKPFTYHQKQKVLRCHHCATQRVIPRQCGHCGSTHLITTGVGTEQLEQVLNQQFPHYQVTRIDRDSTARKGALENHLTAIREGKSQILIGTQMLAKGHHFPNVTLVAIVNVDSALFSTDFRAEEKLAQLYIQVAGRAGRAEKKGEVVLQTHYPDHPLLKTLLEQGYRAFADEALKMRQLMSLPPFSSQVLFKATGKDNQQILQLLEQLADYFSQKIQQQNGQGFQLPPPFSAPMAKKAGHYRWLLLIQHPLRGALQQLLDAFDQERESLNIPNNIRLNIDIDPQEIS
ncbi:TPA: primosomal protein N' [Mannheimia haemolytica]|uniref:Replication restart protein PriA n=1 Tax=Mannheimia haemolytica TaxID=75985 RepID=A0A378NHV6_MANHA|nr:primosomal protein N' [Mannheimia haemolytica]AGQ38175.1 primosome assembly protein PriA [Mannheimia haemolytica D171]EEY09495.1 primosomal replication factor n prime [Mannheimia haemolytica serotype A2 str. OVINE]EEY13135.1 primosomal replication factor n prime [Mannheimia haemolytica serotype A2 str. BOVINE]KYL13731.1 primosomal protein N' [Mannheimia haemolytica]KYL22554.1 primosomal protein N' [Mannheimia haemolytica]